MIFPPSTADLQLHLTYFGGGVPHPPQAAEGGDFDLQWEKEVGGGMIHGQKSFWPSIWSGHKLLSMVSGPEGSWPMRRWQAASITCHFTTYLHNKY